MLEVEITEPFLLFLKEKLSEHNIKVTLWDYRIDFYDLTNKGYIAVYFLNDIAPFTPSNLVKHLEQKSIIPLMDDVDVLEERRRLLKAHSRLYKISDFLENGDGEETENS